jgi:hypothetical protein
VNDLHPVDPDGDRVFVVGVVGLRDENGLDLDPNAFVSSRPDNPPELVLVEAFPHDFEIMAAAVKYDVKRSSCGGLDARRTVGTGWALIR